MADILIYTVGDRVHGMGHVVRCLALADALVSLGHTVMFATQHETAGFDRIRRSSYRVVDYAPDDLTWVMRSTRYQACIVDVENGPDRIMLNAARRFSKVVVIGGSGYVMKDREAIREIADLFIAQTLLPNDADVTGAEYIVIDTKYARCTPNPGGHILISMGGSDPHNMTAAVLDALTGTEDWALTIVNGPASESTAGFIESETVRVIHAPDSLAPYLDGAALFIGALGMSAFEAAAAGVPAILTAWSADHERTAQELERRGCAVSIGVWDNFNGDALRASAKDILGSDIHWSEMSRAGKMLVDGKGAGRVAQFVARLVAGESVMVADTHAERVIHAEATVRASRKGKRDKS